jgi:hypothetical protein
VVLTQLIRAILHSQFCRPCDYGLLVSFPNVGPSFDGRYRLHQERPPTIGDDFDLCQDPLFLFWRDIGLRISEMIELALELGPELPGPD